MGFHDTCVVFDFFAESAGFVQVFNYLAREGIVNFDCNDGLFLILLFLIFLLLLIWFLARLNAHSAESVSAILAPFDVIYLTFKKIWFRIKFVDQSFVFTDINVFVLKFLFFVDYFLSTFLFFTKYFNFLSFIS